MGGIGVAIFAFYAKEGIDPVANKTLLDHDADKIFPYFVLHELPAGLPGLLVAGVLGSTMSVFAGGLNASATSLYVDIIENALGKGVPKHRVVRVSKILTCIVAVVAIGLAFAAAKLGNLVQESVSLMGLMLGPLLAVNLLGMLTTRANWQGAFIGLVFGASTIVWIFVAKTKCTPSNLNATLATDQYGESEGYYTSNNYKSHRNGFGGGLGGNLGGSFGGGFGSPSANDCAGGNQIGLVTFYWFGR